MSDGAGGDVRFPRGLGSDDGVVWSLDSPPRRPTDPQSAPRPGERSGEQSGEQSGKQSREQSGEQSGKQSREQSGKQAGELFDRPSGPVLGPMPGPVPGLLSGPLADPTQGPGGNVTARPSRAPGALSLLGALACVVVDAIAIATAVDGGYLAATLLAQFAIVVTVVTFAMGLYGAITARGRRAGVIGAAVSVVANPLVLVALLAFLGAG